MNYQIIKNFYDEVTEKLGNDYKIILEPDSKLDASFIEKDSVKWELEDIIVDIVNELKDNINMTLEDKILKLYEYICLNYIYDDNVLYFFKKDKTDINNIKYIACDWYGRIIDNKWIDKRKKHNRRICYEYSRLFAKAINIFLEVENRTDMEAFILGLNDNTHYITVISSNDYSAILDLDDFNKIKDLTRIKLGLTMEGITILRDDNNILGSYINEYNNNRLRQLKDVEILDTSNKIEYIKNVIKIINGYNLDSQGFQEYMKNIIDSIDIKTDKIWKKETDIPEKRFVRCLLFDYENNKYVIDSVDKDLKRISNNMNDYIIEPEDNFYEYYGE